MNPLTIELMARRYMGKAGSMETVQWAIKMIEEGYNTPHLLILASMAKPLYSSEIDFYFYQTLKGLGWNNISPNTLLKEYILHLARKISEKDGDVLTHGYNIYDCLAHCSTTKCSLMDFPFFNRWLLIADGLDPDSYFDLTNDTTRLKMAEEALRIQEYFDKH